LIVGCLVTFPEKVVIGVYFRRRRCLAWSKYASNVLFEGRNKLASAMRRSFKTFSNPSPWAEHLGRQRGNQFVTFRHKDLAYRVCRIVAAGGRLSASEDDALAVSVPGVADPLIAIAGDLVAQRRRLVWGVLTVGVRFRQTADRGVILPSSRLNGRVRVRFQAL
jgi:hypothetical protein